MVRGYSHSTITVAFNKATSNTQSELLQPKMLPPTNGIHLPFVIPYNTDLPQITHILRHHWHFTQSDNTLSQLFPRQPFLSYTRHKNLTDILVHSRFSTHDNKTEVNTTTTNPNATSPQHTTQASTSEEAQASATTQLKQESQKTLQHSGTEPNYNSRNKPAKG